MSTDFKKYLEFKKHLDSVSNSFCVAKWQQVTVHLAIGHTHSCHHPPSHKIPLEELTKNLHSLHNTEYKKQQRKLMLENIRPSECDYCWKIEDSGGISDRIIKSSSDWAYPFINDIGDNPRPSYLEVSFSNVCNFKCSYCGPEISSKWMDEIKNLGPYPTSSKYNDIQPLIETNKFPIPSNEPNPYLDSFWPWFDDIYNGLKVLRVTGGEPLMSKELTRLLEYLAAHPNPELELNINSNLCVSDDLFNSFLEKIKNLQETSAVGKIKIYTSNEAHGRQAEYIRFGLNYEKWYKNCQRILDEFPNIKLTIISTYNCLSITSYQKFLEDFLDLRKSFQSRHRKNPVGLDIPYLRNPRHLSCDILPNELLFYIQEQAIFINNSNFFDHEKDRFQKNLSVFKQPLDHHIKSSLQRDFKNFIIEHDKRRSTYFKQVFPELKIFFENID